MSKRPIQFARSAEFLSRSRRYLAGGVSSGMRAVAKPLPLFFASGSGSSLTDVDGNQFIDYSLAWGPLILGHSHPAIISGVGEQLRRSQLLGAQHELEIDVAKKICQMVPCAERVVFNNTGSEAVQIAFRLARAFTGRHKIIRFEGHYHGWLDNVLIGYRPGFDSRGDRQETWPSEGMSRNAPDETLVLQWNNLHAVERVLQDQGREIAAIITEPILCNSHCLLPAPGYLEGLRNLATRFGVLLIFDEVITGFRVAVGGAQSLFGIKPDIATFGKAVAGGFPLSVVAGSQEIMELVEQRRIVHAGSFNGNPISLAAARATLEVLDANQGAVLKQLRRAGETLMRGIKESAEKVGIPVLINGVGASFNLAFTVRREMLSYRDTLDCDASARDQFLEAMLASGVYLMPDGRWYVSAAHSDEDIESTLDSIRRIFIKYQRELTATKSSQGTTQSRFSVSVSS
jgi:glutamate-1-semialdehyde 2,1-aminomutase